jgi:alkanesulfonate monooxygenase SsuD/methylene tetrahydromethanopterin reductase-like flavin-dependent oxidoreductase (luciferase family)
MKVGLILPIGDTDGPDGVPSFADILAVARAAEDGGLDSGWVADHLVYRASDGREYGLHEAWTVLAGVAGATRTLELGTMVLCTSFRNAVLTAKMAAAIDVVSNGRFILGIGCGWHEPEYQAMGLPFADRVSRFEESFEIIRRLLDGERVTMDGPYTSVRDAVLLPPPSRRIPILVAASKPRMMRLTAQFADAWNTAWYGLTNPRLRESLTQLAAAMAEVGRPAEAIERTVGVSVRDPDQSPPPEPDARAFAGSIDELADLLRAHQDLGFGHAIVALEPVSVRSVERLAEATRRSGVQAG